MRGKLLGALLLGLVVGVVALGKVEVVIPKLGYEVKPGVPGYMLLVIPNTSGISLNKFGISLAVEGTVTGALALQGTGPAVVEGGPMYWTITLPGAGLAPKGVLLVSVKVPAGTDLKTAVVRIVGYKVS